VLGVISAYFYNRLEKPVEKTDADVALS
jgi:hypothetical protein